MFLFVVEINHTEILSCIFGFCLQEFCFIPKSYQTCTFREPKIATYRFEVQSNSVSTHHTKYAKRNKSHKKLRCKVKLIAIISYIHGAHSISYAHTHTLTPSVPSLQISETFGGRVLLCTGEYFIYILLKSQFFLQT